MTQNLECPSCLGVGEAAKFKNSKKNKGFISVKTCQLCEGSGQVHEDLANDYLNSLQVINYEEHVY